MAKLITRRIKPLAVSAMVVIVAVHQNMNHSGCVHIEELSAGIRRQEIPASGRLPDTTNVVETVCRGEGIIDDRVGFSIAK